MLTSICSLAILVVFTSHSTDMTGFGHWDVSGHNICHIWAAASNPIALFGLPFLAPVTTDRKKKKDLSQIKALLSISDTKWKKKLGGYLNLIYNPEPNLAQYNPQSNPKPSCNMNNRKKLSWLKPIKVLGLCSCSRSWQLKLHFCDIFALIFLLRMIICF